MYLVKYPNLKNFRLYWEEQVFDIVFFLFLYTSLSNYFTLYPPSYSLYSFFNSPVYLKTIWCQYLLSHRSVCKVNLVKNVSFCSLFTAWKIIIKLKYFFLRLQSQNPELFGQTSKFLYRKQKIMKYLRQRENNKEPIPKIMKLEIIQVEWIYVDWISLNGNV